MAEKIITTLQAANLMGVRPSRVRQMIRGEGLTAQGIGGTEGSPRIYLLKESDVLEFDKTRTKRQRVPRTLQRELDKYLK